MVGKGLRALVLGASLFAAAFLTGCKSNNPNNYLEGQGIVVKEGRDYRFIADIESPKISMNSTDVGAYMEEFPSCADYSHSAPQEGKHYVDPLCATDLTLRILEEDQSYDLTVRAAGVFDLIHQSPFYATRFDELAVIERHTSRREPDRDKAIRGVIVANSLPSANNDINSRCRYTELLKHNLRGILGKVGTGVPCVLDPRSEEPCNVSSRYH